MDNMQKNDSILFYLRSHPKASFYVSGKRLGGRTQNRQPGRSKSMQKDDKTRNPCDDFEDAINTNPY